MPLFAGCVSCRAEQSFNTAVQTSITACAGWWLMVQCSWLSTGAIGHVLNVDARVPARERHRLEGILQTVIWSTHT